METIPESGSAKSNSYLDQIEPKRIFNFAKYFFTAGAIFAFGVGIIKYVEAYEIPNDQNFLKDLPVYLELSLIWSTGILLSVVGFYLFYLCTSYGYRAICGKARTFLGKLLLTTIALVYLIIIIAVLYSALKFYINTNNNSTVSEVGLYELLNTKEKELINKYSVNANTALNTLYGTEITTKKVSTEVEKVRRNASVIIDKVTSIESNLNIVSDRLNQFAKRERVASAIHRSSPIYFRYNSDEIDSSYKNNGDNLKKLIDIISSSESYIFTLQGKASPEGSWYYNNDLGLRRADRVKSFLVENGIRTEHLVIGTVGERDLSHISVEDSRSVKVYLHGYAKPTSHIIADFQ